MNKTEKIILKTLFEHHGGLLSPVDMINGVAKRDEKSLHSLIVDGYIDEVPNTVHERNYTFYRITNKGKRCFDNFLVKAWNFIKSDLRNILVSSLTALVTTLLAYYLSGLFK